MKGVVMDYIIVHNGRAEAYDNGPEAFFVGGFIQLHSFCFHHAEEAARLAVHMVMNDPNDTPYGALLDYLAEHYKRLSKMDKVSEMLVDFYENK